MNRKTAFGLLNYAASYLEAASHLVTAKGDGKLNLRFDAPIELLVGHGFEILLKAYLRSQGKNENELKSLGHDLEKLLQAAQTCGLTITRTEIEFGHLQLLNARFGQNPYEIRYLETGSYQAHDDRIILALAKRIEHSIRPAIQADYSAE